MDDKSENQNQDGSPGTSTSAQKPKFSVTPVDDHPKNAASLSQWETDASSALYLTEDLELHEPDPSAQDDVATEAEADKAEAEAKLQHITTEELIKSFVVNISDSADSSDSETTAGGVHISLARGCRAYLNVCTEFETNENLAGLSSTYHLRESRRAQKYGKAGLRGLANIGNTCFMNATLQCLSNTAPLLRYILKDRFIPEINTTGSTLKGELLSAFVKLVKDLWKLEKTHAVDPTLLKTQLEVFAPTFQGCNQQDSHELLRFLLDALHEELNRVKVKPEYVPFETDPNLDLASHSHQAWQNYICVDNSQIINIFAGQLKSTLVCCDCGHTSVTFEPFWDLSIPIPPTSNEDSEVSLEDCLEAFTKEEILDENEKAFCSKCQSQQKTTKSLSIERFPEVLVIHLKRFTPGGKLNTIVRYPLIDLDLGPFTSSKTSCCSYNLYGISNHSGSESSGHYVAYCKHPYTNNWSCYDDRNIHATGIDSVKETEAYVLFYEMSEGSKSVLL